jgi:hypothetical protein
MIDGYRYFLNLVENGLFKITKNGEAFNEKGRRIGHTQKGFKLVSSCISKKESTTGQPYMIRAYLHRLVYLLYGGIIPDGYMVDFIDGDKNNCHIDNLKLVLISDHVKLRFKNLESKRYVLRSNDISNIKKLDDEGKSIADIALEYNVSKFIIYRILTNRSYKVFSDISN